MSFFPLQKLKGSQPAMTPSTRVAHLEEDSTNKEEYIGGKDPDGIKGITEGVHCMPCQSCQGHSVGEEVLLSLWQPTSLHLWLPTNGSSSGRPTFKLEGGDCTKEGSPSPSRKGNHTKGAPGWDNPGVKRQTQTPFLNPYPFTQWYGSENIVRVRVNGEGCMALLDNGTQVNTITPEFIKTHCLAIGPLSDLVSRGVICAGMGNTSLDPLAMSSYGFK